MSDEKSRDIHYQDFEETSEPEYYSGPVKMGREREYFQQRNKFIQEFIVQNQADLEAELKKPIDTSRQLFGISNQNINKRVSLDEKYPGEMLFRIKVDNMFPVLLVNSYVLLKFSDTHKNGAICVFRYKGATYVNQIKFTNKQVIAVSFNKKYKPYVLDPDHYYFIAVVNSFHGSINEVVNAYEELI